MKVSRTDFKYIVDTLMFLCVLGLTVVGGLLAFIIPEGPAGGGNAKYFLGVHRHQWGNIHLYLSLAFAAFLIIHIVLGWSWIRGKARKVFGKAWKPALAATVLAAALVPVLFWSVAAKNDPAYADYGAGRRGGPSGQTEHRPLQIGESATAEDPDRIPSYPPSKPDAGGLSDPEEHEAKSVAGRLAEVPVEAVITGQTTLRDIERKTGISASHIASELGLPGNVSTTESLGRLRRRFGFAMEDVRKVVAAALEKKAGRRPPPAISEALLFSPRTIGENP